MPGLTQPADRDREPASAWRIALAFLLAPVPSIAIYALREVGIDPRLGGAMTLVAIGAYVPLLIFGVPLYCLLRDRVRPRLVPAALLAGSVAVLPWLLLTAMGSSGHSQVGAVTVMENGQLTWPGFWLRLRMFAEIFAMGALAGALFWAIAGRRRASRRVALPDRTARLARP